MAVVSTSAVGIKDSRHTTTSGIINLMKWAPGYTIIEVMLFLAISGGLLMVAFIGFNGRNAAVQFSQAMQDVESQVKQVLSDVQNGNYPSPDDTSCRLDGSGAPIVETVSGSGSKLGTTNDCVFLGKILSFGFPDSRTVQVDTLVGNRSRAESTTNLALPRLAGVPLREELVLGWGAKVLAGPRTVTGKTYTNLFGVVNGLDATRQQPVAFSGTTYYADSTTAQNYVNADASYRASNSDHFAIGDNFTPAVICFERADGRQRAMLEIGSNGQSLTTRLTFDTPCGGS